MLLSESLKKAIRVSRFSIGIYSECSECIPCLTSLTDTLNREHSERQNDGETEDVDEWRSSHADGYFALKRFDVVRLSDYVWLIVECSDEANPERTDEV